MTFGYAGNYLAQRPIGSLGGRIICKLAEEDYGVDTLKITDDDAAFILGKGGKTKVPVG